MSATPIKLQTQTRFPYRFFVVTFLWSWIVWTPLVLGGLHVVPLKPEFLAKASLPATVLAAFGPAIGALYSLRTLNGRQAVRSYSRAVLDIRLGWKAWCAPPLLIGGITCAAWMI